MKVPTRQKKPENLNPKAIGKLSILVCILQLSNHETCFFVYMYKANGRKSFNYVKSHELICHFIGRYLVHLPP